jgi:hypothetical protein
MAKTKPPERLVPPASGITVRMYRAGLGDCFLLAFGRGEGEDPRYVLIDCGIHSRQDAGPDRLAQVMADVVAATGGKIHVVVPTHEHADHLSGFVQKNSPLLDPDAIRFDQLWVAWTEKRGNPQADRLRRRRGAARAAIRQAIKKLREAQRAGLADRLASLDDFEEMPPLDDAPALADAKKKASGPEVAIAALIEQIDESGEVKYCEPGNVLTVPDVPGLRAYVLGPPRDEDLLEQDKPTGGKHGKNRETYLTGRADLTGFRVAPGLGLDGQVNPELRFPFERDVRRHYVARAGGKPARAKWPGAGSLIETPDTTVRFFNDRYFQVEEWRRIDTDWLGAAEQLALHLGEDTNNTSLVLAFEWGQPGQGPVMLFVGDAQVGNWLSWRRQKYKVGDVTQTVDDLLRRTVLYKVGHHGSDNATLKRDSNDDTAYGLELMPGGLVALIPVDRKAALKPRPWDMPHAPLYRRLLQKASGRVLRSDGREPEWAGDPRPVGPVGPNWQRTPGIPGVRWREAAETFEAAPKTPLYYDVEFHATG